MRFLLVAPKPEVYKRLSGEKLEVANRPTRRPLTKVIDDEDEFARQPYVDALDGVSRISICFEEDHVVDAGRLRGCCISELILVSITTSS